MAGRTIFRRRPARRVRIAWRTWMPWYEPARLLGEAQDMADRAEGVLLPAGGLVVVTAGLVVALPALALVWPVIGAGALLALLLAAPGDEGKTVLNADLSLTEGKSLLNRGLSIVEERREGAGYGNNNGGADDGPGGAGAVDLPRLPRASRGHGGLHGHDGRAGPAGVGTRLRHGPVSARLALLPPGGDKRADAHLEEAGLDQVLGTDSTGGWADE